MLNVIGAAAIRNIVSRDRTLCQAFIDRGAEDILNEALTKHEAKVIFIDWRYSKGNISEILVLRWNLNSDGLGVHTSTCK